MNTTTQERPCIETVIVDGALVFGKVTMRRDFVNDVDLALHRLLNGEVVQVQERTALTNALQKTIGAVLAKGVTVEGEGV
jgi:hypothetical protein